MTDATAETGAGLRVVASAAISDRGLRREHNEDRCLDIAPLFAIADGVGGAAAGEVAAQLAIDALARGDRRAVNAGILLRAGFATADADILRVAAADPTCTGMATTLTAAFVGTGGVALCHVGDSRAYLLRAGRLHQLTRDHSWVGELVERGSLSAAQAAGHPMRSVITRSLGGGARLQPDLADVRKRPADTFLLCSDGLTDSVGEPHIEEILRSSDSLRLVARELVAAANHGGGRDNVTVVLFRLGRHPAANRKGVASSSIRQDTLRLVPSASSGPTSVPARPVTAERSRHIPRRSLR